VNNFYTSAKSIDHPILFSFDVFDFKIKHVKGKENTVVDALSRSVKMIHLAAISTCETDVRERVGKA